MKDRYDPMIGQWFRESGSMKYILDKCGGQTVSQGFQAFMLDKGTLMGINGSQVDVVLYRRGECESE